MHKQDIEIVISPSGEAQRTEIAMNPGDLSLEGALAAFDRTSYADWMRQAAEDGLLDRAASGSSRVMR